MRAIALCALVGTGCVEGPAIVEVGTGIDHFVGLTNGERVEISRGLQGGYLVYGSVRASNFRPDRVRLHFTLVRARDHKFFAARDDVGDLRDGEHAGTAVYMPDPTIVRGVPCLLHVDAFDADGRWAENERMIMPVEDEPPTSP